MAVDQVEPADKTATNHPRITVVFGEGGDLTYDMRNMSGVILHAIAAVLHHEAEKLLFQQDMMDMQKAQAKAKNGIVVPGQGN